MGFWSFVYGALPDVWFKGMNLRSYTGIILVDSIKARRRDRVLRKALKRLKKKYTADKIGKLYQKYSNVKQTNPKKMERNRLKFDAKLKEFIQNFLADFRIAKAYTLDILRLIAQSLLSSRRESKSKLTNVEIIFAEMDKRVNELKFPMREVQMFKAQLQQMLYDLQRNIRNDELSDLRVERGGYPVSISTLSFLSVKRWWSRRKIFRKVKKESKKLNQKMAVFEQILARLNEELATGQIRQDFLFLVIEFCKLVDVEDASLENIKQDLDLILKKLEDELGDVEKSLTNLMTLLRNEPEIKADPEFGKAGQELSQLKQTIQQIPQQEFKNTEALRIMLKAVLQEEYKLLAEMEQQAIAA